MSNSNPNRTDWLAIAAWITLALLTAAILSGCKVSATPEPGKGRSGSELSGAGVEAVQRGVVKVQEALPAVTHERPKTLLEGSLADFREAIKLGTDAGDAARKTEAALASERKRNTDEAKAKASKVQNAGLWIAGLGLVAIVVGMTFLRSAPIVSEAGGAVILIGGGIYSIGWLIGQWWGPPLVLLVVAGLIVAWFAFSPFPNVKPADDASGVEIE